MRRTVVGIFCVLATFILFNIHATRLIGLKYQRLAYIAEKQERYNKMLDFALVGLKKNPYNIDLNGYAGGALLRFNKNDKALIYLKLFLEYYPYHLNVLVNQAIAYRGIQDWSGYIETAKRIDQIFLIEGHNDS